MLDVREGLEGLNGESVSGTATIEKTGRTWLLKDIYIDGLCVYYPSAYLAVEDHLWTKVENVKDFEFKDFDMIFFKGYIYEYDRKDGSKDYSVKIIELKKLDVVNFWEKELRQMYCEKICSHFNNGCYKCGVPNNIIIEFINEFLYDILYEHKVKIYDKKYNGNTKKCLKSLRQNSQIQIDENLIYLGMHKADFLNRFKQTKIIKHKTNSYAISANIDCQNQKSIKCNIILDFNIKNICTRITIYEDEKNRMNNNRSSHFGELYRYLKKNGAFLKNQFLYEDTPSMLKKSDVLKKQMNIDKDIYVSGRMPRKQKGYYISMSISLGLLEYLQDCGI